MTHKTEFAKIVKHLYENNMLIADTLAVAQAIHYGWIEVHVDQHLLDTTIALTIQGKADVFGLAGEDEISQPITHPDSPKINSLYRTEYDARKGAYFVLSNQVVVAIGTEEYAKFVCELLNSETSQLQSQLTSAQAEIKIQEMLVATLTQARIEADKQLKGYNQTKDDLRSVGSRLNDAEHTISVMRDSSSAMRREIAELNNEINRLRRIHNITS